MGHATARKRSTHRTDRHLDLLKIGIYPTFPGMICCARAVPYRSRPTNINHVLVCKGCVKQPPPGTHLDCAAPINEGPVCTEMS